MAEKKDFFWHNFTEKEILHININRRKRNSTNTNTDIATDGDNVVLWSS